MRILTGATALLLGASIGAQGPTLVVDMDQTPVQRSSDPSAVVQVPGGPCVFAASTCDDGRELWAVDSQGVRQVADIHAGPDGSFPSEFTVCGNLVFFRANDGQNGAELWVTDGTSAGTQLVADVETGAAGSEPQQLICCGGEVFFFAYRSGVGFELHASDGTAAGTRLVRDIRVGRPGSVVTTTDPVCCDGIVYFVADDGTHGEEIWTSDGTTAGTQLVVDFAPGTADGVDRSSRLVCCRSLVFFSGNVPVVGAELCKTDGTAAGTQLVKDLTPSGRDASITELVCCNDTLFFRARPSATGAELYKSDGTAAGTGIVKDIRLGSAESFPASLTCCNGFVFFRATGDGIGSELFKSDGTEAGTVLVKDIVRGSSSGTPNRMVCCGNRLYFTANDVNGRSEPHVSDGTAAGTFLLADIQPGSDSSFPGRFACCGAHVMFTANGPDGEELYRIDPTTNTVTLAADIEPGTATESSEPRGLVRLGADRLVCTIFTAATGRELAIINGSSFTVFDLRLGTGSSTPLELVNVAGFVFFTAFRPDIGRELWVIRPEPGSVPELVEDIRPGASSSSPRELTEVNDEYVAFAFTDAAIGRELGFVLVADLGTDMVVQKQDIEPGAGSSNPADLTEVGTVEGTAVVAGTARTVATGKEVLVAKPGDHKIVETAPGSQSANPEVTEVESTTLGKALAYFAAQTSFQQLFVLAAIEEVGLAVVIEEFERILNSDGEVKEAVEIELGGGGSLTTSNDEILFVLLDDQDPAGFGEEPYLFRGASKPGGQLIADLNPGPDGSAIEDLFETEGLMFFSAFIDGLGRELGVFNKLTETIQTFDILPGPTSGAPSGFTEAGDRVWFCAGPDADLYSTDGQSVRREFNFCVGESTISDSMALTPDGLYLAGFDPSAGTELWLVPRPGASAQRLGSPCNRVSRTTSSPPTLGQTLTISSVGGSAGHVGVLVVDIFRPQPTSFAGCDLWVDLPNAVQAMVSTQSNFDYTTQLPNQPALIGAKFNAQTVWAPLGTFLPIVSSNGVLLTADV